MGMDAGDVCIFWPHVRLLFCNGGISEAARLAWSGTGGPGTLGHGHARRPDVNFVHEGGREGAAGPVAGHGQGWLGTATALHTRSLVMTDYDYDQWYNVLVLPACQGCGADITADPSRRSLDATAPTPNLPRFVFGENGTQQGGGGGSWSLDFSNPAGCIPVFFLIFPTHKGRGLPFPEFPYYEQVQRSGETKENMKKVHSQEPRKQPDRWGARTKANFAAANAPRCLPRISCQPARCSVLEFYPFGIRWCCKGKLSSQRDTRKKNKIPRGRNGKMPKTPASLCEKVASKRRRRGL